MNAALFSALPDPSGAEPPAWVHLMPCGTFRGVDGRGPYTLGDAAAVIAASMAGGKLAVDENHATDYAMTTGQPSPARGWIVEMQSRADGIWGRVTWSTSGAQLMSEGAYRGISPVFTHTKAGAVVSILRAALTNTPNLGDLATLHNQEPLMDLVPLRAALGLAVDAAEPAILARVTENAASVAKHSADITRLAAAAGSSAIDADGLATALAAQRANAGDTARMAGTIVELQTQVTTLLQGQARERAETFVDGAIKAGKPISALRDHYVARHVAAPAAVETELNALVSLNAGGITGAQLVALNAAKGGDGDWTAEEKMSCEKMGISKEKFMKNKKKQAEKDAA